MCECLQSLFSLRIGPHPADAGTGLPAQRPDGISDLLISAQSARSWSLAITSITHECELATECAQHPIGQFCARHGMAPPHTSSRADRRLSAHSPRTYRSLSVMPSMT